DAALPSAARTGATARTDVDEPAPSQPPPRRGASPSGLELEQLGWVIVGTDGFGYLETRLAPSELTAADPRAAHDPAARARPRTRRALDRVESRALIIQRQPTRDGDPAAYDVVACGVIEAPSPTTGPTS
ncbi:hypothetical protein L6R52_05485, partial [Myxococcota bacterium]|nr:hypothetical protein [Myxococcota bacterium]